MGRHTRFFGQGQRNGVAQPPRGASRQRGAQRICIQTQFGVGAKDPAEPRLRRILVVFFQNDAVFSSLSVSTPAFSAR